MKSTGFRRTAFRLTDLMVLLLIFAILVGMAVPAIVRLREASRRSACKDNLKAIGMAAHDYHAQHECLPPGWLGPKPDADDPSASPNVGVLAFLLPHIGHDELHRQLWYQGDVRARTDPPVDRLTEKPYVPPSNIPWWKLTHPEHGISNLHLAQTRIGRFICPSANQDGPTEGIVLAVHLYGEKAPEDFLRPTIFSFAEHPEVRQLGRTNYLGVAGCVGPGSARPMPGSPFGHAWKGYEGIFLNRSDATLGQLAVQDGASNTLMFGESCGEVVATGDSVQLTRGFSWFVGALPTYYGLPRRPNSPWHAFSSNHRVVHFVRADGSALGVYRHRTAEVYHNDWWILQEMAGKRDGGLR